MTAQRTDLITGGAIAVIGAVYYIATFSIQETANIVTPRTFPAIVGIALIVLGLFLAGQAVYRARKAALAETGPGNRINGTGSGNGAAASAGESAASAGESAASDETAGEPSLEAPPEPAARKVVFQFALFFVYLAILIPVGFLLSTAAFLMGLTSIYSPQKWIRNLIFSIGFALVVYLAFVYGLAVYLPVGILG
ncbi:tripartite tricarboxylate transporter TctB family protein [Brevibacterium sp. SMBL_HHYL_HB1]|jgi:putative tricarboxylic transport membrane protein|uniref:tripartite tricarboxylate transporter TctB family protein n=1 Tax=Brevibacterium sp. SMBL_HHYL_HB1 TaxID=2777556 RepID=UPI001BAE5010|nr:tripartite tricarboxylate transporter TctB family protein [Brevibacterium sp. SMBL_HHYL_HB1]QUL78798.1 tripartite tricarboxylate transporter TctB family protein [Brevibacterium sp. SMBL_HHYL_HB1]